ncbi:MAG: cytochrome P450 [Solirubrobacterales bacterium]|nr:cytochrome P450 [Solirubrobacterales bacterium]
MPLVTDLDLPELDPADPGLRGERWHAAMAELRAGGHWLARAPLGTIVLDRAAGEQVLRSRDAIFPGVLLADLFQVTDGPLRTQVDHNIINVNGADHARLRSLVNPALSPRAAARWRPAMREILEALWAPLAGTGRCEFVGALAKPYPSRTIARVMGAPEEDAPRLHDWSMWIQRQFDAIALSDPGQVATIQAKVAEFYDWVRPLIARRRRTPSDDLISTLIRAEQEGDRLSDVELENLVLNVLVGGVDTTQSQLAHAVRLLAERPDQWAALRADPEGMAPRAAEEALRFEPITPLTARLTTAPLELRDVAFPEGSVLIVCSFTGNRDPGTYADPDAFDITAPRETARMLTFGAGIHYCVGANLARAERGEGLAFLARHIEELALDGPPELQSVSGIYGVDALPIAFSG